jgi:hypothetical protein
MKNLILKTRLLVLKKNLEEGVALLQFLERQGKELEDLHRLVSREFRVPSPASIYSSTEIIQEIILKCVKSLNNAKSLQEHDDQLQALRKEVNAEIDRIHLQLNQAQRIVLSMQTRKIEDDRIRDTISHAIGAKASHSIQKLEAIQTKLNEAEKAETRGDSQTAEKLLNGAWDDYLKKVDKESQPVLTEYVEFLGGLALRHTGLDAGVCQIADELLSTVDRIERTGSGSLTIPARHEAMTAEVARIIRLGYPEWTIWALPLVAHQFGHLVVSNNSELQKFIEQETPRQARRFYLQHYLADAFAAYTLGPAYACAALFLRFNLVFAYKENRGDQRPAPAKRAHIIFSMLEWVNKNGKDRKTPYAGIIDRIRDEWDAALQQNKHTGKLEEQEDKKLKEYVDFLGKILLRWFPVLRPPKWESLQVWPDQLLQNTGKDIKVDGTEEFRDVLNAAWVCRISQSAQTLDIDQAATTLWERIKDKKQESKNTPFPWIR